MTISSKLFATQMLDQFKVIENRLQSLNTQISTGTRITKSSDAPIDAVTLTARSERQGRIYLPKRVRSSGWLYPVCVDRPVFASSRWQAGLCPS